jgi:hypothetical protein
MRYVGDDGRTLVGRRWPRRTRILDGEKLREHPPVAAQQVPHLLHRGRIRVDG